MLYGAPLSSRHFIALPACGEETEARLRLLTDLGCFSVPLDATS